MFFAILINVLLVQPVQPSHADHLGQAKKKHTSCMLLAKSFCVSIIAGRHRSNIATDHCLSSVVDYKAVVLPSNPCAKILEIDHCPSSAGAAAASRSAMSFCTVAHLNTATQQPLANAVCASVMFVQCTEHRPSAGQAGEASLLDVDHLRSLGSCVYSSIRGLVEHTRLQGCLRCAESSLLIAE